MDIWTSTMTDVQTFVVNTAENYQDPPLRKSGPALLVAPATVKPHAVVHGGGPTVYLGSSTTPSLFEPEQKALQRPSWNGFFFFPSLSFRWVKCLFWVIQHALRFFTGIFLDENLPIFRGLKKKKQSSSSCNLFSIHPIC